MDDQDRGLRDRQDNNGYPGLSPGHKALNGAQGKFTYT